MVVSVLLERDDTGAPLLRYGTALVVPKECAAMSWGDWRRREQPSWPIIDPRVRDLPAEFLHDGGDWLAARAAISLAEGRSWLAGVSAATSEPRTAAVIPGVGSVPPFRAGLRRPRTVVRVLHTTRSTGHSYVAAAVRPAIGTIWTIDEMPQRLIPFSWDLDGLYVINGAFELLGLNVPTDCVPEAVGPPFGLLVGRLERRAWITDLQGDGPQFESLRVQLSWDPGRIDLLDLDVDLEQYQGDELVNQLHLSLADIAPSEDLRSAGACELQLPTIGRGVASEVSLRTRDGALLDRTGPFPLVERINITLEANGSRTPINIGIDDPLPGLEERSVRQAQIRQQIQMLASEAAEGRVLVDREAAEAALLSAITHARGELLIHDRFFGQSLDDWRLLDDVPVPVRVVTAKIAEEPADIPAHVQARHRAKAPMHDRFYPWEGGGLSLGGSPTTFGHAPILFGRLSSADSLALRKVFEALWESELFTTVPRK